MTKFRFNPTGRQKEILDSLDNPNIRLIHDPRPRHSKRFLTILAILRMIDRHPENKIYVHCSEETAKYMEKFFHSIQVNVNIDLVEGTLYLMEVCDDYKSKNIRTGVD